ncbi:uncharacterized protein BXIN_2242 [Babesia sp. Xinjiang]|uniref:uncharacterized protein n=1 Tax=Babesia sp. Xinjiang TaxID=462227 RepID=UPI000A245BA6|nr:uncharacterized protein BXIN_2242 [Babesia sp. Xinjiang]ORM40828.1 hypothetical protein BXIN_2242 [Babesia sp. Xinjiang]
MGNIIHPQILALLLSIGSILSKTNVSANWTEGPLNVMREKLEGSQHEYFGEEAPTSTCLFRNFLELSNVRVDNGVNIKNTTLGFFAWLASLPLLVPNVAIINENVPTLDAFDEFDDKDGHKFSKCVRRYYRVDFGAYHSMINEYHRTDRLAHRGFVDVLGGLISPSIRICGRSAHTMPFAEENEINLYGLNGYRNAFTFIFFLEPFKVSITVKRRIKLRERMDTLWRIRSRLCMAKNVAYVARVALRYRNVKFVEKRLSSHGVSMFSALNKGRSPLVPFFNVVKDDFLNVLEGTNLLVPQDYMGTINVRGDSRRQVNINFDKLVKNLGYFLTRRGKVVVGGSGPFYVAELCIRKKVYTLHNVMEAAIISKVWRPSMRYAVAATFHGVRHMSKLVALVKIFGIATVATVLAFGGILRRVNVYEPLR